MKLKYKFLLFIVFVLLVLFFPKQVFAAEIDTRGFSFLDFEYYEYNAQAFSEIKKTDEYLSGDYFLLAFNHGDNPRESKFYFIPKNADFKIYVQQQTGYYSFNHYFTFTPSVNVVFYKPYVYQSGSIDLRRSEIELVDTGVFDINMPINFYSEVDIYSDNTFSKYFYLADKFAPSLNNLYFVETLDGFFLQTDKLNYDTYIDYDMYLYSENTNVWSRDNIKKEIVSDYSYDSDGIAVFTTRIQYRFPVLANGVYTFRLQHNSEDVVSNSYTYTITDFAVADKLIYDIHEPYYTYDYENGNAIIYTNYLPSKYIDNVDLYYYDETASDWRMFSNSIISKEYNNDKSQFRFKLKFVEPVSYSCRFIVNGFGEYGLYYSDTSSFTVTQDFFDNEGYEEQQGIFAMIGSFIKDLFSSIFIPTENRLLELKNVFEEKFAFIDSIKIAVESIGNIINNDISIQTSLNYEVDTPIYEGELSIDFGWFEKFKPYTDLFLTGFIYLGFVWRLYRRLPSIIAGLSS